MKKYLTKNRGLIPRTLIAIVAVLSATFSTHAQHDVSLKTNLLYDATTTINLGAEITLAPKWSFDLSGNFNGWSVNGHLWKHWMLQPEARYWFCDRMSGHFVAMHLLGGQYNIGNISGIPDFLGNHPSNLENTRIQGWYAGAGIGYGYSWILSRHWNIEAEIAFGWAYTRYDRYPCAKCDTKIQNDKAHNYVGPTKAAVNLIYVF